MSVPPPSAEAQLAFLARLQRVFSEGDFTATYKFALLVALADLSVELGSDDGSHLRISIRQIAKRFVALYWHHAAPYGAGGAGKNPGVLIQNEGTQAAVLSALGDFRARAGTASLAQAPTLPGYTDLLQKIAETVSAQPLKYLQNFVGTTQPFLYERDGRGFIRLKPGVPYCLRRFHSLVQRLARTHWIDHIKANRRNRAILGDGDDLEDFLFGTSRHSLNLIAQGLKKIDGDHCFYCRQRMDDVDVDHYIPLSIFGRDLAQNFVLAHPRCNRSKSDTLAAKPHLEQWIDRLSRRSADLMEVGCKAGVSADIETSGHVMRWAYGNAVAGGASAWLRPGKYQPVDGTYVDMLLGL